MAEPTTATRGVGEVLRRCREAGRAALIGYLPVGYPTVAGSIEALRVMVEAGVDIVEVGVPYSDPLMDGPVIQHAADVALAGGVRVDDVFTATAAVRETGAPPLVMTYWNIVLHRGVERFAADLAAGGGAGLITPDLIPDEAADWIAASDRHGLDRVFLVAPSSPPERLALVSRASRGFVYAASTMGVTGARTDLGGAAEELVARTREVTDLPVCVGLGVSTREQAAEIGSFADGVIVGSALVRTLVADGELSDRLDSLRALTEQLAVGRERGQGMTSDTDVQPSGTTAGRARAFDVVGLLARLVLGVVLLVAGGLKVTKPRASAIAVHAYQVLPYDVGTYVGYALPLVEIVVGLLLVLGLFTRVSAVAGTVLMVVFIVGITQAWARGLSIDCGCFGGGGEIGASQTQYPLEILRDVGLALCGAWLVWRPRSLLALDSMWEAGEGT